MGGTPIKPQTGAYKVSGSAACFERPDIKKAASADAAPLIFIFTIPVLTDTSSALPPYPASPTEDPDHDGRNVRMLPSAYRSDGADPAS